MYYLLSVLILVVIVLLFGFLKYFIESIKKHENTIEILNYRKEILLKEQFLLNKKTVICLMFNSAFKERLSVLNIEIVSLQKSFLELILKK